MVENETPSPAAPAPDASIESDKPVSRLSQEQLEIVHRPGGPFHDIVVVGYAALNVGDLKLAEACSSHVLERASQGSGDLVRALVLHAEVYLRRGNTRQHDKIMDEILAGRV